MDLNSLNVNENVTIKVAGENVEVKSYDNVRDTLKKILSDKGITSFTILVDGEEITDTADLPSTFEGYDVEVQRYVKPGC